MSSDFTTLNPCENLKLESKIWSRAEVKLWVETAIVFSRIYLQWEFSSIVLIFHELLWNVFLFFNKTMGKLMSRDELGSFACFCMALHCCPGFPGYHFYFLSLISIFKCISLINMHCVKFIWNMSYIGDHKV